MSDSTHDRIFDKLDEIGKKLIAALLKASEM